MGMLPSPATSDKPPLCCATWMRDQRRGQQERDQDGDRTAGNQGPTEEAQQRAEVAGMANHPIEAAGLEPVAFLTRHQAAEPTPQHGHGTTRRTSTNSTSPR